MIVNHQFARVRLVPVVSEDKDDEIDNQILIDLVIDPEANRALGSQPCFGIYGSPVRDDCYPFLLLKNGDVDFGSNCDASVRFERLNLRDRPIRIGEVVTYASDSEEWCCKIVSISRSPTLG